MDLRASLEPAEDLELYLGYSRESARYADYADIRHKLMSVAPSFDFDRALTAPGSQIVSVRDGDRVRGMAVLALNGNDNGGDARPIMRLYYADDSMTTRALMSYVEGVIHGYAA